VAVKVIAAVEFDAFTQEKAHGQVVDDAPSGWPGGARWSCPGS
jgi:hypothetical protein